MRHDFIDRYSRLSSPIHRLPTSVKFGATVLIICTIVSTPYRLHWIAGILFASLFFIAYLSTIPWKFLLGRLLLMEPFVLGIALLSLFQQDGLTVFLTILTKSTLCIFSIIILSNTTPFSNILDLLRKLGTPSVLVTILALAYRYVFVLIDEGERILQARNSRSFAPSRIRSWVSLSTLIGQLFVRSSERAERIFAAMTARGWK